MILYEEASKSKDYCEVESLPCGVIQALHGGHSTISSSFFFVKKKLFSLNWLCLLGGCNSDLIFLDLGLHRKQQTTSLNPRQWTSRTPPPPPLPPKKTQKNDMEYLLIKFLFVWKNRK